jgi:hypothetical protein
VNVHVHAHAQQSRESEPRRRREGVKARSTAMSMGCSGSDGSDQQNMRYAPPHLRRKPIGYKDLQADGGEGNEHRRSTIRRTAEDDLCSQESVVHGRNAATMLSDYEFSDDEERDYDQARLDDMFINALPTIDAVAASVSAAAQPLESSDRMGDGDEDDANVCAGAEGSGGARMMGGLTLDGGVGAGGDGSCGGSSAMNDMEALFGEHAAPSNGEGGGGGGGGGGPERNEPGQRSRRKSQSQRDFCWGCYYGMEGETDSTRVRDMVTLWRTEVNNMHPEKLAETLYIYFENEIRQPMLDRGQVCEKWSKAMIHRHFWEHHWDPTTVKRKIERRFMRMFDFLSADTRTTNAKTGEMVVDLKRIDLAMKLGRNLIIMCQQDPRKMPGYNPNWNANIAGNPISLNRPMFTDD